MLSSIVLVSTMVAAALAQNSTYTYTLPSDFNIGLVQPAELSMGSANYREDHH